MRDQTWPPKVRREGGKDYIRVQIDGHRRRWTLGESGSDESRREYLRVVAEIEANRLAVVRPAASLTVADIALHYASNKSCKRCAMKTASPRTSSYAIPTFSFASG